MTTPCNYISCQCDRTNPPEREPSSQHNAMSKDKIRPMDVKVENPQDLSLATAGENPKPSPAALRNPVYVLCASYGCHGEAFPGDHYCDKCRERLNEDRAERNAAARNEREYQWEHGG